MRKSDIKKIIPLVAILAVFIIGFIIVNVVNRKNEQKQTEEQEAAIVFMVEPDDVTEFVINNREGETIAFTEKNENGETKWESTEVEAEGEIDQDVVKTTLDNLCNISTTNFLTDVSPEDCGLAADRDDFVIKCSDATYTLTFGDTNPVTRETYFIVNNDTSVIYTVDSTSQTNYLSVNAGYFVSQNVSENATQN